MVLFNNIKKCQTSETFLNIYQDKIYVSIKRQNNAMGVTVRRNSKIYLHFIIFILLFLTNVTSFVFNLISTALFSIVFIVLTLSFYIKLGCIIEETLIIIKPLGYQLSTKYLMGQKSKFIPYEKVQNVFINEVIFKQKIIYLLTILAKESSGEILLPLFEGCKPRLSCLEFIYKVLFQDNT
ncbi:hypothetical protein WA026_002388 [Henosepilachna vigintioctopunctata]|uniref:Phosphatidylinositol N-acetylglucosaminyltransferase subunit H conserved domain-containing protein n=1 Tax=Henosepilachna vigintioctopunctata TaxID=420089 RepID=A0AAW1TZK5_9CUCU